jgi:L-iditol 2-dehydrogenase
MLIPAHAVARGNLFRVPDHVPLEAAALVEPMGCCINGQREMGLYDAAGRGDEGRIHELVIFGAGPIGLMHLMLARAASGQVSGVGAGAPGPKAPRYRVTVVEPRHHRREFATRLGADEVLSPEEFQAEGQFDAAILAVGVTDLVGLAFHAVRKMGKVSLFAGFDVGASTCIDPNSIHYKQIRLTGASESRRRDFAEALALVACGRIDPSPLITARLTLAHHQQAFRLAGDGSALKVAFKLLPTR